MILHHHLQKCKKSFLRVRFCRFMQIFYLRRLFLSLFSGFLCRKITFFRETAAVRTNQRKNVQKYVLFFGKI